MRRSSSGFTLLELLIAIVVFSLLAGIALPNLRTLAQSWQVRGAAAKLEQAVRQTRAVAVAKNQSALLCLSNPSGGTVSYTIVTGTCASPVTTLAQDQLPTNVTATVGSYCNSTSPYLLPFTSRGSIDTSACTSGFSIPSGTAYPNIRLSYSGNTAVAARTVTILSLFAKVTIQ